MYDRYGIVIVEGHQFSLIVQRPEDLHTSPELKAALRTPR
jgi:hypothetical protein